IASRRAERERIGTSPLLDRNQLVAEEMTAGRAIWILCAFVSGVVTISMQVVWSRVLTMIIGSSTYAFTIVLALFLIGLAMGAWIVSRKTRPEVSSLRGWIFWLQLFSAASLFLSLRFTNYVPAWLINAGFRFGVHSWPGLLTMQLFAAAALILAPTILMGMMMPLVLMWTGRIGEEQIEPPVASAKLVGQVYAVNTIGSIFGALVTAFVLIPMASTRFTVFCAAALGLAIAAVAFEPKHPAADRAVVRAGAIGSAAILIVLMLLVWPPLNLNALSAGAYDSFVRVLAKTRGLPEEKPPELPGDHRLLMYTEGRTATVAVRRDWGIVSMSINGRTNGSDADDMPTQVLAGQLGLLVAPRTDKALMTGFATGVSVGSALQSPVKSVDCVELEPAAVTSSNFFNHVNNRPLDDPRLHVIIDDARTLLRVNPQQYDLIMSEPSHPWVPGVANLFTREFFALGRERLNDDGVFVQWVQIYQLSTESLRSVLATFNDVFPHVAVFRVQGAAKGKDLILLGSRAPIDLSHIDERMKDARVAADLARVGLQTPNDVRAWFVCDETRLRPAVRGAIINTDDNMHVETAAPREAFRPGMEENSSWIERLRLPN
ncbi:MAG TPA: fused MFS/spermidine synthase, partial [Pyrinomonadaceae bacterium]